MKNREVVEITREFDTADNCIYEKKITTYEVDYVEEDICEDQNCKCEDTSSVKEGIEIDLDTVLDALSKQILDKISIYFGI
jgi:hypothetical protein